MRSINNRPFTFFFAALILALCPIFLLADVVELDEGQRIQGVITRQTDRAVEVQTSGGRLSLSRARIKSIEPETQLANTLQEAEADLRRGQTLEAAQEVEESLRKGLSEKEARLWCARKGDLFEYTLKANNAGPMLRWTEIFRQLAHLPEGIPTESARPSTETLSSLVPLSADGPATLTLSLSALPSSPTLSATSAMLIPPLPPDERDFLLVIGRVLSTKGQARLASEMIGRLDAISLEQANQSMPFVQPLIVKYVKGLLDASDFESATDMIAKMRQAGMVGGEACQILLLMRWSSFARRSGRYEEAMDVLSKRLEPISPELAKERMAVTLAEARESVVERGDYQQVISLHIKWMNWLPPDTRNQTLALLYHDWGNYLLDMDQPVQARAVLQQYYILSPQADQKLLDLCTYKENALALDSKDFASHFELGQWAAEHNLVSEAIESFERAAVNSELQQPAQEQVEQLKERVAVAYMDRCMKLFEQGDPRAALDEMAKLPFMPTSHKIEPEMKKLRELCYGELKRRSELRMVQAETLFQDAQRRFFLNETASAVQDLQNILRSFSDTPVAERAAEFLRYAQTRKTLQKIDGAAPTASEGKLQAQSNTSLEKEINSLVEQLQIDDSPSSSSVNPSPERAAADTPSSVTLSPTIPLSSAAPSE